MFLQSFYSHSELHSSKTYDSEEERNKQFYSHSELHSSKTRIFFERHL